MLAEMKTPFGRWWNMLSKIPMRDKESIARSAWAEAEHQAQSRITQLEAELLRVYQDKEDIRDKLVEVVNEHGIMVEALEEIASYPSGDVWDMVNFMQSYSEQALAKVKD